MEGHIYKQTQSVKLCLSVRNVDA